MFKTTDTGALKQDKKCQPCWYIILSTMSGSTTPNALRSDFFDYLTEGIKTLKEQGKKEKRNLEIITLTFPQITADSHKEDGARRG